MNNAIPELILTKKCDYIGESLLNNNARGKVCIVMANSYLSVELIKILQNMLDRSNAKMSLNQTVKTMMENISLEVFYQINDPIILRDLIFNEFHKVAREITLYTGKELSVYLNSLPSTLEPIVKNVTALLRRVTL